MKFTLFLALCVALSTAQISIYSNFTQQNSGSIVPTEQFLLVQNNLPFSKYNSIYSVTFQVCVRYTFGEYAFVTYPPQMGNIGTFYAYVGAVAAGSVNGTAGFYINGLPGTYTITASVFYRLNGTQYSSAQDFQFTIHPAGSSFSREVEEETVVDDGEVAVAARAEGDIVCNSCNFAGVQGQPTWNAFQFHPTINIYSISYTCQTNDINTAIANVGGPSSASAGNQASMAFTLSGSMIEVNTLTITLKYRRGSASGPITTWGPYPYNFTITSSGGKRDIELLDFNAAEAFAIANPVAAQAQNNAAVQPKTVSIEYAFGAAVAGIALVAAVAVIAVIAVFRSKKINSTQVA